jgi:monoamine oxidase
MISYTDAQDTLHWSDILNKKGEKALEKEIMKATRELFPEIKIPDPTFFKPFLWNEGCSYWAPGVYNPRELSRKAHHPIPELLPNVYLCGESYSMKQCWMEGALEHADELINRYFSGA